MYKRLFLSYMYLTGSFTTSPRSLDEPSPRSASSSLQIQSNNIFCTFLRGLYTIANNNHWWYLTSSCCMSNFPSSTAIGREISWGMSLPSRKILLCLHTHLWEIINDTRVLLIRWGHSPSHFFKNIAKVTILPTIRNVLYYWDTIWQVMFVGC